MILINGSNFVDGINTLFISYIIMILLMMLFHLNDFIHDSDNIKDLLLWNIDMINKLKMLL